MDKNLKKFIFLSSVVVVLLLVLLTALGYIYRYFTIHIYNLLILFFIFLVSTLSVAVILSVITVLFTYRKKYVRPPFIKFAKAGLNILMPFIALICSLLRNNKDIMRKLYIDINNIIVQSYKFRFPAGQILLLVPHCLQESGCGYKITRDIKNCRQCNKCCIGDIAKLVERTGIRAAVVTGGTAARQAVEECRPKLILSVACERDLTSGISDIKDIPVIGIVNKRPNGPCYNTFVDVSILKQKIYDTIDLDNV